MRYFILLFLTINLYAGTDDYTRITSEGKLVIDYHKNIADFYDKVVVNTQGGVLKSDFLKVIFDSTGKEIEQMIARGHVFINQREHEAESEEAVFYARDGKLVLKGNPTIKKGPNCYSADRIIIETKTNKVYFEPSAKIVIKQE